ncbi:MAG: type II toxin-antitoxin system PemK/MazF family toxin [Alphaproteobacteria bacterium]|nr:type II toxin-antitoxin system PemK/MazF family toxin [Alphaproteobacteria bacterium]MDP6590270.1 type II toxin-antitoxin system PemK/MazF family toxin [Alphaproteobacteria bacterium]
MAIHEHPPTGTILRCKFDSGFRVPEMVKTRPVVVISPKISVRHRLCTVVPIGSEAPHLEMPYHHELIDIQPALPPPFDSKANWVKGDMVVAVSFERLDFLRLN